MSLLDNDFDINEKDIIEIKCVNWIKTHILRDSEYIKFKFDWKTINFNSIIKYPKRYCIGIMEDCEENIYYIAVFNKYYHYDPYCCYDIITNTTIHDILNQ
jgi:hypothetical protein